PDLRRHFARAIRAADAIAKQTATPTNFSRAARGNGCLSAAVVCRAAALHAQFYGHVGPWPGGRAARHPVPLGRPDAVRCLVELGYADDGRLRHGYHADLAGAEPFAAAPKDVPGSVVLVLVHDPTAAALDGAEHHHWRDQHPDAVSSTVCHHER